MTSYDWGAIARGVFNFFIGIATIAACLIGCIALATIPEIRTRLGLPVETPPKKYQQVYLVGISDLYQIEKYNLGLEDGQQQLLGIPFEIGWKITTQCSHTPNNPVEVIITDDINNPIEVYFLIQAGWGIKSYDGYQIGLINLNFIGESTYSTPLILGTNIRDWSDESEAVTTLNSPNARTAFKGIDPNTGKSGHIDMLIIKVPQEYKSKTIDSIDIIDTSMDINPCIHLLAISAEIEP